MTFELDSSEWRDTACFKLIDSITVDSFYIVHLVKKGCKNRSDTSPLEQIYFVSQEEVKHEDFKQGILDFASTHIPLINSDDLANLWDGICMDMFDSGHPINYRDTLNASSQIMRKMRKERYQITVTKFLRPLKFYVMGFDPNLIELEYSNGICDSKFFVVTARDLKLYLNPCLSSFYR
jgi:hypothetical protein